MHVRENGRTWIEAEAQCLGTAVGAAQEHLALEGNTRDLTTSPRDQAWLNDIFLRHLIRFYSIATRQPPIVLNAAPAKGWRSKADARFVIRADARDRIAI